MKPDKAPDHVVNLLIVKFGDGTSGFLEEHVANIDVHVRDAAGTPIRPASVTFEKGKYLGSYSLHDSKFWELARPYLPRRWKSLGTVPPSSTLNPAATAGASRVYYEDPATGEYCWRSGHWTSLPAFADTGPGHGCDEDGEDNGKVYPPEEFD